jgi:hypothetical protein
MKHKNYYVGYHNLKTGKYSMLTIDGGFFDTCFGWLEKDPPTIEQKSEIMYDLINNMELKRPLNKLENLQRIYSLCLSMVISYKNSDKEFGNENFYVFRTNEKRFHTIGTVVDSFEEANILFDGVLESDYHELHQNW